MSNIAIILPAYNEEMTIQGTIESFFHELPDAQIIVVNNNSQDRTAEIAAVTLHNLKIAGGILNEPRQGKGHAIRKAFTEIDAEIYIMVDADQTYPANRVHDLIAPILCKEADMVVGDRLSGGHYRKENKRNFHDFGNNLVKTLINKLFNAKLNDIMTGYRAFSKKFVKNYPILVDGFQIETDLTLHALDKRFSIREIEIEYKDRPHGSFSKLNTFADGFKVISRIINILRYYKPLLFFGILTLFFGTLGLLTAIPVIHDWIEYHYIYHVPSAVLAVAFELLSAIFLSIGLILDSVIKIHKLTYETSLINYK